MKLANTDSSVEFALRYEQRALYSPVLKHRVEDGEEWQEMTSASYKSSTDANGRTSTVAMANINEGGAYVVEDKINVGALVAIYFAALVSSEQLASSSGRNFLNSSPLTSRTN
eukprot:TRINITY_DN71_c0_g1_i2.p4 TRINITY_DN71_c0_g1~~TRINITY_DN71_c0_g1_i2.p4  ORF type:complete len:113 (-),score=27.79 TRINITY_DN71_c0_g1_i2:107-445(-)